MMKQQAIDLYGKLTTEWNNKNFKICGEYLAQLKVNLSKFFINSKNNLFLFFIRFYSLKSVSFQVKD